MRHLLHFSLFIQIFISFVSGNLLAQDFDPKSVIPAGCNSSDLNCGFKPTKADQYLTFSLSPNSKIKHRGLPSSFDLSSSMPPVGSQGQQGSCVAWATTYALKSSQEKKERNWNYDIEWGYKKTAIGGGYYRLDFEPKGDMSTVFSPAFTYNQINRGYDQGSFIGDALELITTKGAVPYNLMPYNEKDYLKQPNSDQLENARKFKGLKYYRVDFRNVEAMKAEISKGNPIVIGMKIDDGFTKYKSGVYDRPEGASRGGHAMTIVGYDDGKESANGHKGAYKLINSWGTAWGEKGYGWVSYKAMAALNKDAWVLIDEISKEPSIDPQPSIVNPVTSEGIPAPADLNATRGNYTDKIILNWSLVKTASAYIVERAEGNSVDNFIELGYSDTNSFSDTNVEPDISYRYRVISVKMENEEEVYSKKEDSPIVEGYAKSVTIVSPPVIGGLVVNQINNKIELKWNPIENISSFEVSRYNQNKKVWEISKKITITSFIDAKPFEGRRNYYSVRGTNASGVGKWSEPAEIFVGAAQTKPSKVTNVTASRGSINGISVNWNAVSGAEKYFVYRFITTKREWANIETVTGTSYLDKSEEALKSIPIGYVIIAANDMGYSDYSELVYGLAAPSFQMKRGVTLAPPKKLEIKVENGFAKLKWEPVKDADEYYIFIKKRGDSELKFLNTSGKDTKYSHRIDESGILYGFAIKSKSELGGESAPSPIVSAFINQTPKQKKKRFLKEAGIENFTGKWKGEYWDGEKKMESISLVISNTGNQFQANLSSNNTLIGTYKGTYAAMSDFLEADGFQLQAKGPEGKISEVSELIIKNPKLSKSTVQIGLIRE